MQITVFSNDGRFPVQFELAGLSQMYRFRQSETLKSLGDIEKLVDSVLMASVLDQFSTMRAAHSRALNTFAPPAAPADTDGLPDII
jgi:hypothetical protein